DSLLQATYEYGQSARRPRAQLTVRRQNPTAARFRNKHPAGRRPASRYPTPPSRSGARQHSFLTPVAGVPLTAADCLSRKENRWPPGRVQAPWWLRKGSAGHAETPRHRLQRKKFLAGRGYAPPLPAPGRGGNKQWKYRHWGAGGRSSPYRRWGRQSISPVRW